MATSVRYLNRQLLQNVLHHVDTHNRLMEEKEMWKMKRGMRASSSESSDGDGSRLSPGRHKKYGKMRSDNIRLSTSDLNRNIFKQKLEEGKWNHSGFMELYPDEFLNKESMDEMSSDEDNKEKKRKKKKQKKIREKSVERNGRMPSGSREETANHSSAKLANERDARTASHEYARASNDMRDKRKWSHGDDKANSVKKMKYSEEISEHSSASSGVWNELESTVFDLKNSPQKKRKTKSDSSPKRLKNKKKRRKEKKEKHRKHEKRKRYKHDEMR